MAKSQSIGVCELCKGQFSKGSMSRHLASCVAKHSTDSHGAKVRPMLHLAIEGRYLREHWIHIETAAESKFADLDSYLRDLWLECCGHMSAFRLPKPKPAAAVTKNFNLMLLEQAFRMFDNFEDEFEQEQQLMGAKLGSRLKVGDAFDYDYDFGSTTELKLKVVAKRDGTLKPGKVRLLARNLPPDIRCGCGKPAVNVCTQCLWDRAGWLCKACSRKHKCGDEMFLPVVNSPRVGVCGYVG